MAYSFYGVRLSKNTGETPEGYFFFKDAVIARTGTQRYKGSELPQRTEDTPKDELTAQDLGIGPDDQVDMYRPAEEVFSPATIASFQGKPITDEHPEDLLDLDTVEAYHCGHISNVRMGKEPLETGDMPLLADGIITNRNLILKIKSGLKDLSCGYNYQVGRNGNQILQINIIGNHVAVVPNGRAGLATIKDSALPIPVTPVVKVPVQPIQRERYTMAKLDSVIRALGFKAYAQDAKPEDLADAIELLSKPTATAKDADEHPEGCRCTECKPTTKAKDTEVVKPKVDDAKVAARKKFHDALDEKLDAKEAEAESSAKDAENVSKELGDLFAPAREVAKETLGSDEEEAMDEEDDHEENEEARETEETAAADEDLDKPSPIIEPINRQKPDVPAAVDRAAAQDGAISVLKALRPVIAASSDKAVQKAFDSIAKTINKSAVKKFNGSYKAVAAGAVARDTKVDVAPANLVDLANSAYAAAAVSMATIPGKK